MNPIRVVLVGTNTTDRSRIARRLEYKHNFSRFAMLDGVRRIYRVIYGAGVYKGTSAAVKYDIYDALYKISPDFWLTYMDSRLLKTDKDVVIPDPRYVYEVDELVKRGFVAVRVINYEGKKNFAVYKRNAAPGTVMLHEHFASKKISAYYQVVSYKDTANTDRGLEQMVETLRKYNLKLEP